MSYDYDWCGHTAEEPDARPCGAPIERWSREWKHRKFELDQDHKAVPQAPIGPMDEALFLRADRYAATLAASVAADERIAALTELVRQHEYYRSQAESQLSMVQEDPQFGTVWAQTGPEPGEDVHALLCLTTGRVYLRNKWTQDWQYAHHNPQHATHYAWPIPDAGPFIGWRDGYQFDRVLKDAQAQAIEFDELHRRWYGEPGYHDPERGIYGPRPRLADADQRIRGHMTERTYEANRKAQAADQKLRQLRRLIEHLRADDTQQWPATDDGDGEVRDVAVIDLAKVHALLGRADCGGAS